MRRVSSGWVLSFDMRQAGKAGRGTPTVGIDRAELLRLFGAPPLLRRPALNFGVAQAAGRHDLLARTVAAVPSMRTHHLGLWRAQSER